MTSQTESPFWQFSLGLYAQQDVAESCIELQDSCGVDVNVMLYILWLACQDRKLSDDDIVAIQSSVEHWKTNVVLPLRNIRRALKTPKSGYADIDTARFREKVKTIELESEKLQQDLLFGLMDPSQWGTNQTSRSLAAKENILAYEHVLGTRFSAIAIQNILAGLRSN